MACTFVSGLAKGLSSDNASAVQEMKGITLRFKRSGSAPDALCFINKQNRRYSTTKRKEKAEPLGVMMTAVINEGKAKK